MGNHKITSRITAGVSAASIASLVLGAVLALPAEATAPTFKAQATGTVNAAPTKATDRFVVTFAGATTNDTTARDKTYEKVTNESGIALDEVKSTNNGSKIVTADKDLSAAETAKVMTKLKADPNVVAVEPDLIATTDALTPTDPLYPQQWHLNGDVGGIRAASAWKQNIGEGQTVAVIDTGITNHSDLNANVLPGYDMISSATISRDGDGRDSNPQDEGDWQAAADCSSGAVKDSSWHGTHVAGIIAAAANGAGTVGVAPGAKILPVRALGACGGYMSDISDGIIWAAGGAVSGVPANPNPARIINLSLSSAGACPSYVQSAINTAVGLGSSVFVAAGNYNSATANYSPANCNNVITVAASGMNGEKAYYSNYGPEVDITAPGGDGSGGILSTINAGTTVPAGESYKNMQGTSMASPVAAAVGALMLANEPTLTPVTLEAKMKETARPLPVPFAGSGAGLIDAAAAVAAPLIETVAGIPTVTGSSKVGTVLTGNTGDWIPGDVNFTYAWKRNGVLIPGAVQNTYSILESDYSSIITLEVTGSKEGYTTVTKASGPIVVIEGDFAAPKPTITGTVSPDHVVHAEPGQWAVAPDAVSYQWNVNDVPLLGETAADYTPTLGDVGKNLSVTMTASRHAYNSTTVTSTSITVGDPVILTAPVTISGVTKFGNDLTVVAPEWTPAPVSRSYQWQRSGEDIAGAVGPVYSLTTSDIGKTITVSVKGEKFGYNSVTVVSAATAPVALGTITGVDPKVLGTAKVGSVLTAISGGSISPAPVELSYQWQRSGMMIFGANSPMYTLTGADAGKQITVVVTAVKTGYAVSSVASSAVTITPGTLVTAAPTINGVSKVGSTLTASPGVWTEGTKFSYQWYRSGAAIPGAGNGTYVIGQADVNSTLTVKVTGSMEGYTSVSQTSNATSAVPAVPVPPVTTNPVIPAPMQPVLTKPVISVPVSPVVTVPSVVTFLRSVTTPVIAAPAPAPIKWLTGISNGYSYQWVRSGDSVTLVVGKSYVLFPNDHKETATVIGAGVKAGFEKASAWPLWAR